MRCRKENCFGLSTADTRRPTYEPQWNKKKTMARDTFTSKFTGQSYDVDVLHDMLREVRGKYDTEQEIVVDFARRVRPTARRLHQAMIPFCGGT